jgi:hypothetical protein
MSAPSQASPSHRHATRRALGAALGLTLALGVVSAEAAPSTVTLEGKIELPPGPIKEPPPPPSGFNERIPNALAELRPYDPRPECFVALEGNAPAEASAPGKPITWLLGQGGLSPPVLPVVAGTRIELKVQSGATRIVTSESVPELKGGQAVGPGNPRTITAGEAGKVMHFTVEGAPDARLVPMPSRYFARLKKDGSYAIDEVPPGKWTVRVWCKDGWVSSNKVIEIARGVRGDLVLPEQVDTAKASP